MSHRPEYRNNTDRTAAITPENVYMPMRTCPIGVKCILLTLGGVATLSSWNGKDHESFKGWFPLPKKPKEEKSL